MPIYYVICEVKDLDKNFNCVKALRDDFVNCLKNSGLNHVIHSDENCSPYVVSVSMIGCRAETLLNMLNDRDILVGNGSACSSKNSDNRILKAIGVSKQEIESNLRISFSKYNTRDEVACLVKELTSVVDNYLQKVK